MEIITRVVDSIIGLGAPAVLPITFLILGLIFKLGFAKSIKIGITVGIGFIGIGMVIGLLMSQVGSASQDMVNQIGLNLSVVDGGWASAAAAGWSSSIAGIIIVVCLITNIFLIFFGITKTLYIDIWNYWYFLFISTVTYTVTGSLIFSVCSAMVLLTVHLLIADWLQPYVKNYFELDRVTLPTGSSLMWVPLGFLCNKVLDYIPGINRINVDYETIEKKFGIFGEPTVIGVLIGIILGLLAGYGIGQSWLLGVKLGAVIYILPRMIKILLEGLIPLSKAAQVYLKDKLKGRELHLGLDSAIALGDPAIISSGLILVPIMIFLAAILPGNMVLPFGDLASIPFYIAFIVAHNKGNIVKTIITGSFMLVLSLYMATSFAGVYTELMANVNFDAVDGSSQISSITSGGSMFNWLWLKFIELF